MAVRLTRWQLTAVGVCVVAVGAAAASIWQYRSQTPQPPAAELITSLTQRCQLAMLRDVCGVMKGSAPNATQARLFIAGIGEVDAQVFARLRAAGDTMCQELATECQTDWSGQACRIGKALYPELTNAL